MVILRFYKSPGLRAQQLGNRLDSLIRVTSSVEKLESELCYYIDVKSALSEEEIRVLKWILSSPFQPQELKDSSAFERDETGKLLIEIGPRYLPDNLFFFRLAKLLVGSNLIVVFLYFYRLNFSTALSSNAVSICKAVQLDKVTRIEVSTRYLVHLRSTLDKTTQDSVST